MSKDKRKIIVFIPNEKKRSLFKNIDSHSDQVFKKSKSKRVISVDLFDQLQVKFDRFRFVKLTLIEEDKDENGEVFNKIIVKDARPGKDEYDALLRAIRF